MKIIDFSRKGNVVKLYTGTSEDYTGDDWDDTPYEHNAGRVYDEYIEEQVDMMMWYDDLVLEPCDNNELNSRWSKNDMKERKVPCLIIVPAFLRENDSDDTFDHWSTHADVYKFYFGDDITALIKPTDYSDGSYTAELIHK